MSEKTILLSAGGTGGHLFPAEALAHELTARGWTVHLATDKRAERFAGAFAPERVHQIDSATIGSRNPIAMLRALRTIWRGARQATVLINRIKPSAVIGFGGYPTVPPLWAATRRGVPTIVHEQNAVMGRANRMLAARVTAIAGGFLPPGEGRHAAKTVRTGNPIRPAVIEASRLGHVLPTDNDPFRLLIFGGSQGAQFFSQVMPAALAELAADQRRRLVVTQQARAGDEDALRRAYEEMSLEFEVAPFFADLPQRMAAAHLVISRSGASTVSEIAAIGRSAILVPYPHALDHDQAANAKALEAAGGAEVYQQAELGAERIADLLSGFMNDPDRLQRMAKAARSVGQPDAARLLADLTEAIAAGHSAVSFKQGAQP